MSLDLAPPLTAADLTDTRARWRDRVCARLGGWCELLRRANAARIPF